MYRALACLIVICLAGSLLPRTGHGESFDHFHENVLGTSLQLTIHADHAEIARRAEEVALAEIDRLESIFSRYQPDSELSKWQLQPINRANSVSTELAEVLSAADRFRTLTQGAFDVRAGEIIKFWKSQSASQQAIDDARANLAASLNQAPYQLEGTLVLRKDAHAISLDAIAKGYILDRVGETVLEDVVGVEGLLINIGGDIRKFGNQSMMLGITDPNNAGENNSPLAQWTARGDIAVATSGTYRRRIDVGTHKIHHLFDPRTALPISSNCSVSVIATDGMTADALATSMSVMAIDEAIELANSLPGVDCLIVNETGSFPSSGWPAPPVPTAFYKHETNTTNGLHVWFQLDRPSGSRYRRPYLAIWLEDKDGFPVKTAILWLQTEQPGPRWHRDLTRWYRNDRMRKVAEKTDLIKTLASATRGPGKYEAHFDGTDNAGKPLANGTYTLCLEAARENGTYKIIRQKITWGDEPIEKTELKGNVEIPQGAFQFVPVRKQG